MKLSLATNFACGRKRLPQYITSLGLWLNRKRRKAKRPTSFLKPPKIRAALMDIKALVAADRGLEQWKPILKAEFPLESSVIATQVFPSLELPPPALPKAAYELDEFLTHVARTDGRLAVVGVRKTRYQFRIGACAAEYAQIMINGVPRDTVAVESVDPDAVSQLVRELGIAEPNTSYIREIKRVLGWVPQQSGS